MAVEINEVEYSAWVLAKINQKHNLTIDDVFDAIENYTSAAWNEHAEHGRRLLVVGTDPFGRTIRILLYPIDEAAGTFRLGTALT